MKVKAQIAGSTAQNTPAASVEGESGMIDMGPIDAILRKTLKNLDSENFQPVKPRVEKLVGR